MKIKFITSVYSDLNGSELGGRPSRGGHYKYSLLSLLKMNNADFLCYTSDREIDDLENFFYVEHSVSKEKLKFKIFDLKETKFKNIINLHKNIEETKKSDRCVEIQYSKFHWWWLEDNSYDYYYWIDAGLSHCGLIPNKYLHSEHSVQRYYESTLFNNSFLNNLISKTGDKFFIIGKENEKNYWSGTVNEKWYEKYDRSVHVIGGLFGGKKDNWLKVVELFENYLEKIIITDKILPHEENILSLMFQNHKDLFFKKDFDSWWHEDNKTNDLPNDYFDDRKSFYKILEELNGNE